MARVTQVTRAFCVGSGERTQCRKFSTLLKSLLESCWDGAVRTESESVAKGYHVLAGLVRDLQHVLEDAEGSETAGKLLDDFSDVLELLLERGDADRSLFDESSDDGGGDDAAEEGPPVVQSATTQRNVGAVDGGGERTRSVSSSRMGRRQLVLPQTSTVERQVITCGPVKRTK